MEIHAPLCLSLAHPVVIKIATSFFLLFLFFYYPISFLYSTLSSPHYYYSCIVFHLWIFITVYLTRFYRSVVFIRRMGKICPQETHGNVCSHFGLEGRMLLVSSWQKAGILLNILQRRGRSPQQRIYLVQKYRLVLRLRNHDTDGHLGSFQSWLVQNYSTNHFVNILLYINANIFLG